MSDVQFPNGLMEGEFRKRVTRREALKIGGALTAAAAASPLLSACGGNGSTTSSGGGGSAKTLQVYWNTGHTYTAYKQVIDKFQQDHAGWTVNLQPYQWPDMRTKLLANFSSGTVPDLVEEVGGWVPEFGLEGKLHSLQPYINKDGTNMGFPDDWQPFTVKRNTLNGEVYGIQLHLTCMLLFYNMTLLQQAGISQPPTTWDEFLTAAKATTKNDVYGFAPNQDSTYAWPWLLQNNVSIYDPQKKVVTMDNENAYQALQFQADLIHKYKVAPIPLASADYEGPQKLFSAGRAAFIVTGPWDIEPILSGSPDLKWGIAQALKGQTQATPSAGTSLMIPKQAKNPDMAWELIKRFVALDIELAVTKEASMTMPRKSWGKQPIVQSLSRIAPFAQGLTYAQSQEAELQRTGKSAAVDSLFTKAYQDVIYRNIPASVVLQEFVAAANKALAQKGP